MDYSVRPERRVFHLDSECYIIYLGKDLDDYKPFLRIGNTGQLPESVKALIYPIIVTDMLTGSPILERDNLSSIVGDEFQYIGDPATVERYKQFLRHQEFPSQAFEQTASDEMADMGCFVYFYHDGNVRVTFDKAPVFNLRRREEQDRHYLQRAKTIKNHLLRNPLRYPQREFQRTGFFVLQGHTYVFSRGSVGAFDIPDDYFARFAVAGIDPDRVTTVYAPDVSEGLIRLFKRVRSKDGRVHVLTDNPAAVQNLVELFRVEQQLQLKSEVVKLHPDRFTHALDLRFRKTGRTFVAESDALPLSLVMDESLGAVVRGSLAVSAQKRGWLFGAPSGVQRGSLLEGVPHIVIKGAPPLSAADVQRYLPAKLVGIEDLLSAPEAAAYSAVRAFFTDLANGAGDLPGHARKARVPGKGAPSPAWWMFSQTAAALARSAGLNEPPDRVRKSLDALVEALTVSSSPTDPPPPAVVCDLYVHESGLFPLYRFSETVTADRMRQAESIAQAIGSEEKPQEPEFFQKEEKRLLELLASLDTVKARTRKARKDDGVSDATVVAAPSASDRRPADEKRKDDGDDTKDGGSGRSRRLLIAALLLLLLGAGLLFLLTTEPGRAIAQRMTGAPAAVSAVDDPTATAPDGVIADGTELAPGDDAIDTTDADAVGPADDPDGSGTADLAPAAPTETGPPPVATRPVPVPRDPLSEPEAVTAENFDPRMWEGIADLEERRVAGGITITVLDIIRLANRIALANGYRQMGAPPEDGPNPEWIRPGAMVLLPDRRIVTVRDGETLWGVTADYIEAQLEQDVPRFQALVSDHRQGELTTGDFLAEMRILQEFSNSESFSRMLSQSVQEVSRG